VRSSGAEQTSGLTRRPGGGRSRVESRDPGSNTFGKGGCVYGRGQGGASCFLATMVAGQGGEDR
jgi:hypothetical protein